MTNNSDPKLAEDIAQNVRSSRSEKIIIHLRNLSSLPSLDDLPYVIRASIAFSRQVNLAQLEKLSNLKELSLQFLGQIDIEPIGHLVKLESLVISNCSFSGIETLRNLRRLEALDLSYTNVTDLRAIAGLTNLRSLNLRGSPVSDLTPLSKLLKLESLNVSQTLVTSLYPIAALESLLKGARQSGHKYDQHTFGGILFTGAPLDDPQFARFAPLRKKERTELVLRHLQSARNRDEIGAAEGDEIALSTLAEVPTPFEFSFAPGKAIQASGSPVNWPSLPLEGSAADLAARLAASREIAGGIVEGLVAGEYQVRREYLRELKRYLSKLPREPGTGNILLADAAARTLRTLFAAEADILSAGLASSLKTFLEQHIGLRAYYPEIQTFYADVRDGKLNAPLPLDAASKLVRTIKEYTPAVFETNVSVALDETSLGGETPVPSLEARATHKNEGLPLPPPDPLGEVEPTKARNLAIAATVGKLWKVFQAGQRVNAAITAWVEAAHKLKPIVKIFVDWYNSYTGL